MRRLRQLVSTANRTTAMAPSNRLFAVAGIIPGGSHSTLMTGPNIGLPWAGKAADPVAVLEPEIEEASLEIAA
jgi:hypothetical protein